MTVYGCSWVMTLNADTVMYTHQPPEIHKSVVIEDRENRLWIGAEEGLFRMYRQRASRPGAGRYCPSIWGITEDHTGNHLVLPPISPD